MWRAWLGACVAVAACHVLLPPGAARVAVYAAVAFGSAVVVAMAAAVHRPRRAGAWWAQAAGVALFAGGDLVVQVGRLVGVTAFPGPADVLYLASYVVLTTGLLLLVRARRRGRDLAGLADSAIVTTGMGLISWVVIAAPVLRDSDQSWLARLVGAGYPAGDILLLALLVRLVVLPGERSASFRLLTGAVLLLFAADTAYAILTALSLPSPAAVQLLWLGSYALWGAAALHPSMRTLSQRGPERPVSLSRRRLTALVVAVLLAPATTLVELAAGRDGEQVAVVVASVVMFTLVVARMHGALRATAVAAAARDGLRADLLHQAAHDALTGLANRARTLEVVGAALHRAQRSGDLVALLFVDLDRFKAVNDAHGHRAGDEVLRASAERLRGAVRGGDAVGRLGGDEFVVLLEPAGTEADVVRVAQRVLEALTAPLELDGVRGAPVGVGASIGVAVSRDGAVLPELLLHEADTAAARAKARGGEAIEVFDEVLRRELAAQAELEAGIRAGLAGGEFSLHYQPVVDLRTGATTGYEALARWERPGHGPVPPGVFVPVAETSDLVCELGRWALGEAARQLARWAAEADGADGSGRPVGVPTVAVNLSGRHLVSPRVVDDVAGALAAAGVPPQLLVVEVTETVLVQQEAALPALAALSALGVRIAIDDFGTGYTSIGQLQHLPADVLKVDRSLVASTAPGSAELVQLVVTAAHAFGLTVTAEGVEEPEQVEVLRAAGCDTAQGYHFARPLPADRLPPRSVPAVS